MSDIISIIPQKAVSELSARGELGLKGELLAASLLEREGYRIVMTNFTAPVGRNSRGVQVTGEIDIIALDAETLCFVEVKSRTSDAIAAPLASVDLRKQRQITRTSRVYKQLFGISDMQHRFDAVTVLLEKATTPKLDLYRGFWTEAKFKKRAWSDEVPY